MSTRRRWGPLIVAAFLCFADSSDVFAAADESGAAPAPESAIRDLRGEGAVALKEPRARSSVGKRPAQSAKGGAGTSGKTLIGVRSRVRTNAERIRSLLSAQSRLHAGPQQSRSHGSTRLSRSNAAPKVAPPAGLNQPAARPLLAPPAARPVSIHVSAAVHGTPSAMGRLAGFDIGRMTQVGKLDGSQMGHKLPH